jgi:DNA-directed RNA polymerase subunit RPC12/RpoP
MAAFGPHGWMPRPFFDKPAGKELPAPGEPTGDSPAGMELALDETSDGKTVSAVVGQKVVIRVPSDGPGPRPPPQWTAKLEGESLKQDGEIRLSAKTTVAGPGGLASIQQGGPMAAEARFIAAKAGQTKITLESRPRQPAGAAPTKTYTFTVEVKAGAATAPATAPATRASVDDDSLASFTLVYQCEKCGHEFPKKVGDLEKELGPVRDPSDEAKILKIDCPKCAAKTSCWQERQCPNCKKWYVPASTKAHYEAVRTGRGEPAGIRDVCSHCKTDIQKWYIDHMPKD